MVRTLTIAFLILGLGASAFLTAPAAEANGILVAHTPGERAPTVSRSFPR